MAYFIVFSRSFFFMVLAAAAILKMRDFRTFEQHLAGTLPRLVSGVPFAAQGVIALESAGALSMLLPAPAVRYGFALILALCAGFAAYVVLLVREGAGASCGCMGESDVPASPLHVLRNCALVVIAGAATAGSWIAGPGMSEWAAHHVIAAAPAMAAAAVVTFFDDLIALFTNSPKESH
ncbi:MauE/DoxX family redox-associated membrane protein [Streptomyces sp. NPDC090077]|uniref:MauE/DoxX family redox-associated membrane protein n=1 Tax=Streptomyces sp. NPDC090077 TaxID=3365938 RepID=UPI0037FD0D00